MAANTPLTKELAEKAKCYKCIPRGRVKQVVIYLLCKWLKKKVIFSFEPASKNIQWSDKNGAHVGNLAAFNAIADKSTVTNIDASFSGLTSITGLSALPLLSGLAVPNNNLTSLDVSHCFNLVLLGFGSNSITSITGLSDCHLLDQLLCDNNPLGTLNLTGLSALTALLADHDGLTSLNVSPCPNLGTTALICNNNSMNQAAVDNVLCTLDTNGALNGNLDITNNAIPSAAGLVCSGHLDPGKGWTVSHD